MKLNKNSCGIYYTKKQILKFENNNKLLSDEDMFNLFNGFVRLVKRSVELEVEGKYLLEINKLKNQIKKLESSKNNIS